MKHMDDVRKEVLQIWNMRIKHEKMKQKIRKIEAELDSGDYKEEFGVFQFQEMKIELIKLKKEETELEKSIWKLENKIELPNPYLYLIHKDD